jgi:hypothetical protein
MEPKALCHLGIISVVVKLGEYESPSGGVDIPWAKRQKICTAAEQRTPEVALHRLALTHP